MKISLIGAGKMASAIIGTLIKKKLITPNDVYVYDINTEAQIAFVNKFGAIGCSSYEELFNNTKMILIAVKPNAMQNLLIKSINPLVSKYRPLLVSIVAGKSIENIEEYLDFINPIIRAMPNINAGVGASTTAFCCNEHVSLEHKSIFVEFFSAVGKLYELNENMFNVFTALGSSSPAFTFIYMDALARAAVKAGMDKKTALDIAANSLIGCGKSLQETGSHPWELVDMVCSPGGTSAEGVYQLQKNGFENSVYEAMNAAIIKASNTSD